MTPQVSMTHLASVTAGSTVLLARTSRIPANIRVSSVTTVPQAPRSRQNVRLVNSPTRLELTCVRPVQMAGTHKVIWQGRQILI